MFRKDSHNRVRTSAKVTPCGSGAPAARMDSTSPFPTPMSSEHDPLPSQDGAEEQQEVTNQDLPPETPEDNEAAGNEPEVLDPTVMQAHGPGGSNEPLAEGAQQPDAEEADENDARIAELELRLEAMQQEHDDMRAQTRRIAAEFDNFRKRSSREQGDLKLQLTCDIVRDILPVVDNFERARKDTKPETDAARRVHDSYQTLYKQLVKVLKRLGISRMQAEGTPFDPALHEAVIREPSDHYGEDVITEELQCGYQMEGRVLRHAMVKVSMGPGPAGHETTLDTRDDGNHT